MALNRLVRPATCLQQGHQLLCQHLAHANRVELNEFREHLSELTCQVLMVLLHLLDHVFLGQQTVEPCIHRGVDIGREVVFQIGHTITHQVIGQSVEDIPDDLSGGVAL